MSKHLMIHRDPHPADSWSTVLGFYGAIVEVNVHWLRLQNCWYLEVTRDKSVSFIGEVEQNDKKECINLLLACLAVLHETRLQERLAENSDARVFDCLSQPQHADL